MFKNYRDEIVLILLIILISPLLIYLDLFDLIYDFTRNHEEYQLDEYFIIFISENLNLDIVQLGLHMRMECSA